MLRTHAWLAARAHMACAVEMDKLKTMMWGPQIAAHAVATGEVIPAAWGLSLLLNIALLIRLEWAAQVPWEVDGVEAPQGVVGVHSGADLMEGLVDVATLVFARAAISDDD